MSQLFNLCLATETIATDAQQLGLTIEQLQDIRIEVSAKIINQPESHLWLSYQIKLPNTSLAAQLDWPAWEQSQVGFSDYLWEKTCLECFIDNNAINTENAISNVEPTGYIEINASPSGRYALYQFNSYRNPSILPPTPLLKSDGRTRAHINWVNSAFQKSSHYQLDQFIYERSFGVPLTQLFNTSYDTNTITIERLHPCVILWFGNIALYFAPNHASPPDFHQRQYWPAFDYKAAIAK